MSECTCCRCQILRLVRAELADKSFSQIAPALAAASAELAGVVISGLDPERVAERRKAFDLMVDRETFDASARMTQMVQTDPEWQRLRQ